MDKQEIVPEREAYPAVLDRVFSTNYDSVERQLYFLGELYDLPHFDYSLTIQNRAFFDYTLTIQQFVVLVVYTSSKQIFLFAGTDGDKEQYYLPARRVLPGSFIENAVRELSEEVFPHRELTGFEPVARLTHSFFFQGREYREKHTMSGVAYIARLLDRSIEDEEADEAVRNGTFFRFSEAREFLTQGLVSKYSNADVVRCALDRLDGFFQLRVRQPDEEIRVNRAVLGRYRLHDVFVKPALRLLKKAYRFEIAILESIGEPEKFLDASCGDSKILISVARRGAKLVVGNDVSWSQITLLLGQVPRDYRGTTIFTNHNIVFLPFRSGFFDVVLCKNTLHHLSSPAEFQLALMNLAKVAKKVVIVEVEDPDSRIVSRSVNRYYRRFLRDVGEHFFSEDEFREAIEQTLAGKGDFEMSFSKFGSLHANYLFAEIICMTDQSATG